MPSPSPTPSPTPSSSPTPTPAATTATTTSVFGGDHPEQRKWNGGVLASDGCVYAAPFEADSILKIDPSGEGSTSLLSIDRLEFPEPASRYKYGGGVALANGTVVCFVPVCAHKFLAFDTATQTAAFVGDDYSEAGVTKWSGGTIGSDGCLYCAPADATRILRLDPSDRGGFETSLVGSDLGASKWKYAGAVASPDRSIVYCLPSTSSAILRYEVATGECTRISVEHLLVDDESGAGVPGGWRGGVLGADGCLYGLPSKAGRILKYDPSRPFDATAASVGDDARNPTLVGDAAIVGDREYIGGLASSDGWFIYGIPNKASRVYRYDVREGTTTLIGDDFSGTTGGKWFHGVAARDGSIVGIPYDHEKVLRIVPPSPP